METADTLLGKVLGNCRLMKKIGEGGMGTVYQAHHLGLNKPVAVKILPPSFAREPERIQRFVREARSAAQLEHPNIVQILNVGKQDDLYFIIMQYVQGENLDMMIKRKKRLAPPEATRIISAAAVALESAHQKGIIHRDVKPENIMITPQGEVKLMDFGLARVMDEVSNLSRTGDIMGTPHYLAPEQAQGHKADHRSDIYSLGVTYYYALTGERPFEGTTPMTVILKHLNTPMPDPRAFSTDLPNAVYQILKKMMEKQPDRRYQSVGVLIKDFDAILSSGSQSAGPVPIASGIISQKTITASSATIESQSAPDYIGTGKNKKLFFYLSSAAAMVIILTAVLLLLGKDKQDKSGHPSDNQETKTPVAPAADRPKAPTAAELLSQAKKSYEEHPHQFEENITGFQKIISQYQGTSEAVQAGRFIKEIQLKQRVLQFFNTIKQANYGEAMNYVHPEVRKKEEDKVKAALEFIGGLLRLHGITIKEITVTKTEISWIHNRADVTVNITYGNPPGRPGQTEIKEHQSEWAFKDGLWYFSKGDQERLPTQPFKKRLSRSGKSSG